MSRCFAACLALAALCACATESAAQPTAAAKPVAVAGSKPQAKPNVLCENEAPLGTHFTTRRCRNTEQAEQERQRLQDELLRARSDPGIRGGN